jgi:hypothetical protein
MRNFIVLKNSEHLGLIHESGNLKALFTAIDITGSPDVPVHVYHGLLLAKIGNDIYMVFDCTDANAHDLALSIIKEERKVTANVKRSFANICLSKIPNFPRLVFEEPSYVV